MPVPSRPRRRPGFTLIELLVVIGIIMILASATFGLYRGVSNARMKARARGEIQRIVGACEGYKKAYGDFPCALAGTGTSTAASQTEYRADLFDQLSGRRVLYTRQLVTGGFAVEIWPYNSANLPNGANRKPKPFINLDDLDVTVISTKLDATTADVGNAALYRAFEFRDPWGNPYEYRYRVLNGAGSTVQKADGTLSGSYGLWLSSNFLFVSCGANFATPKTEGAQPEFADYFDASGAAPTYPMVRTGMVPPSYFEDDSTSFRSDNLVNWAN
jgi:prepilin-type N-terminal cleavage/methylation domain-containing protein